MAEPARKLNPEDENSQSKSAQERANERWFDNDQAAPDLTNQSAAADNLNARQRADQAWGMDAPAGIVPSREEDNTNAGSNVVFLPDRQAEYDDDSTQTTAAGISPERASELGRSGKDLSSLLDREKGSDMGSSKAEKGEKNRLQSLLGGKKDEENTPKDEDDDPYGVKWATNIGDGRKGVTKWAVKNRKKLAIGGGVTGAFILLFILLIGFFIPYKLTAIIEDITDKVGETPAYAVERRMEYHINRYLIIRQLAKMGVPGADDRTYVYLGNNLLKTMYVNWNVADIESDFIRDGYKMKPNAPKSSFTDFGRKWSQHTRPTSWKLELPDGTIKKLNSKEAREIIEKYVTEKTKHKSIWSRWKMRFIMKKFFGLRTFKWLERVDDARDSYYNRKRAFKQKLAENTVGRIAPRTGAYLSCMAGGGTSADCKKELDKGDVDSDGKIKDFDSDEVDDLADDASKVIADTDVGPDPDGAVNKAATQVIQRQSVRKILTAIGTGIAIAEVADGIERSFQSGVLNLIVYDKNSQQYVADTGPILSMADQGRSGQGFNSEALRMATDLYTNYEQSPLVQRLKDDYDPSRQIRRDCNNDGDTSDKDDLLEPGEVICRDKRLIQDKTSFTDTEGWKVFSQIVNWYRATPVDDAIDLAGDWTQAGMDKTGISAGINWAVDTSGLDSIMENGFGWLINRIAGPVITGNEEGADKYESTFAGIASMNAAAGGGTGEARQDTIGGGVLSLRDVSAIQSEQREDRQYELQQKTFFARYFSPEVKESLTMQFAMALPSSLDGVSLSMQDGVASIASLKGLRSLGSIFTRDVVAQTPGFVNPFHAVYYGYSPSHPVFTGGEKGGQMSTEEIWDKYNCDAAADKREANNSYGRPSDQDIPFDVPLEADPCLLEKETMEVGTRYFTGTFDEGIDDGTGTGTTNVADTTNPNIYVLGDSLTAGMKAADLEGKLKAKGWQQITIAGACGRNLKVDKDKSCDRPAISPMLGGLQQIDQQGDQTAIKAAGTVVVGLGTNDAGDPSFRLNVETMIDKIRALNATTNIYWVNLFSTHDQAPKYPPMNQILTELSSSKNFKIIDWASAGPPSYDPGNIHPRNYDAMAQYVVDSIGSPPAAPAGGQSEAMIGDPFESSVSVPCDSRTKDIGEFTGYVKGNPIQHRLCAIPNLPAGGQGHTPGNQFFIGPGAEGVAVVNSRASGAVYSMVEAAKADGVTLSVGSSFRTMAHQQELCRTDDLCPNGDYREVAKPGTSNHQSGLALDFALGSGNMIKNKYSSSCDTRARSPNSAMWKWLAKNAERFGYKQYHIESWHYDPAPDGCDGTTAGF